MVVINWKLLFATVLMYSALVCLSIKLKDDFAGTQSWSMNDVKSTLTQLTSAATNLVVEAKKSREENEQADDSEY